MTSIERTAYPRFTRAPSVKELREIYTQRPPMRRLLVPMNGRGEMTGAFYHNSLKRDTVWKNIQIFFNRRADKHRTIFSFLLASYPNVARTLTQRDITYTKYGQFP